MNNHITFQKNNKQEIDRFVLFFIISLFKMNLLVLLAFLVFILSLLLLVRSYNKKSSERFAGMMTAYAIPTLNRK
jgi:putative flippase GtrA